MVFLRHVKHSKRYVMFGEHLNTSMTKVGFHNVKFLEDEFPSLGEIKKHLQL